MTSDEIKQKPAVDLSTNGWLREACLQLALLNEKSTEKAPEVIEKMPDIEPRRGPGRPRKSETR